MMRAWITLTLTGEKGGEIYLKTSDISAMHWEPDTNIADECTWVYGASMGSWPVREKPGEIFAKMLGPIEVRSK